MFKSGQIIKCNRVDIMFGTETDKRVVTTLGDLLLVLECTDDEFFAIFDLVALYDNQKIHRYVQKSLANQWFEVLDV